MTAVQKRTISLPPEQATYMDAQVANGTYASASEVVRAGLRALQDLAARPRGAEDPLIAPECARQAGLIRDAETAPVRALDDAWFTASDRTGWTA